MERTVLHVDCNKFYASVECLHRPELRDKPVAVGGSTESRHGIILTKNEIASRYGLVAGEPLWPTGLPMRQYILVCPSIFIVFSSFIFTLRLFRARRLSARSGWSRSSASRPRLRPWRGPRRL